MLQVREYCVHHAVDMGVAVFVGTAARCRNHEECRKYATFGYKGKPAMYCKTCIPEPLQGKLINVINKRCEYEGGCNTQPSFGFIKDRVSATAYHYFDSDILCALPLLCMWHRDHHC
jgi:hypothetical protein